MLSLASRGTTSSGLPQAPRRAGYLSIQIGDYLSVYDIDEKSRSVNLLRVKRRRDSHGGSREGTVGGGPHAWRLLCRNPDLQEEAPTLYTWGTSDALPHVIDAANTGQGDWRRQWAR